MVSGASAARLAGGIPGAGKAGQAGFTLIELMVVVAIMALLAAIATPSMSRLIASQRVRSAASDLHLSLVMTRSEAIKRNVPVTVSAEGGNWSTGWTVLDPANPGGPGLRKQGPVSGVAITSASGHTQVVYAGTGRTTLATGVEATFLVSSPRTDLARCILVDGTGRPYVKEGSTC